METPFANIETRQWRWLTYVTALAVLVIGSLISFYLRNFTDSLLLYLPTSLAIVLVHWFGLWILPIAYINSYFTLYLWGAPGEISYLLILATREPAIILTSWLLGNKTIKRGSGLTDTRTFVQFLLLGVIIPDTVNSFYTYQYSFINKDLEKVALLWLADFITIFSIALPLLHFFKPIPHGLSFKMTVNPIKPVRSIRLALRELIVVTVLFLILAFYIDFGRYWFVYGIVASLVAVRNGFETVIIANAVIFTLNYVLPLLDFTSIIHGTTQRLNVHMGMGTMLFVSTLVGRTVSDLLNSEEELTRQKKQIEESNKKLSQANIEMDRFVYSVSHDISAPLKSILGLINLSRIEKEPVNYLEKIEQSARKLEAFVAEVLDHSKTNRKQVQLEEINIKSFINESIENLKYLNSSNSIQFKIDIKDDLAFTSDRFLLKVAAANIISNAVKYQKRGHGHVAIVSISSYMENQNLIMIVSDNGEGIKDANKPKVFEMFYRGTALSSGSGLGLFIAKEAAERLRGSISFESTYGQGSTFTISIPKPDVH